MPVRPINAFAFAHPVTGQATTVSEADVFPEDHPYVKMWPGNFIDVLEGMVGTDVRSVRIESATAAPGETRIVQRPAASAPVADVPAKRGPGRPRKS